LNCLEEVAVHCPWCGEPITVVVDCTEAEQCYVEDCGVCCQPMVLDINIADTLAITVTREGG